MKLYLNPENPGHLGDDTFWHWFKREFDSSWEWTAAKKGDIVLQYSVLGPYMGEAKYVALCWEMYPSMQSVLPSWVGDWSEKVGRCLACAEGTPFRTVPTTATAHYYDNPKIMPLGVDTDVFKPLYAKQALREKHGIPLDAEVGFWSGTTHYMKGYDLLERYSALSPDTYWICCWKQPSEAGHMDGAHNTVSILQPHMNELMNCADFFLSTGRLYPLYLVEWEAMAAGLDLINAPGVERELPEYSSREAVMDLGWSRHALKPEWTLWLEEIAVS